MRKTCVVFFTTLVVGATAFQGNLCRMHLNSRPMRFCDQETVPCALRQQRRSAVLGLSARGEGLSEMSVAVRVRLVE